MSDEVTPLRVYIGSGGRGSKTVKALTEALRSHKIHVSTATELLDDIEASKDKIVNSHVALIVVGQNPLALVEGGICIGLNIGPLWVLDGDEPTPLAPKGMTANQAISTIAEIKESYEAEMVKLKESEAEADEE